MTLQSIIKNAKGSVYYKRGFRLYKKEFQQIVKDARRLDLRTHKAVLIWGSNGPEWITVFFACILQGVIAVPLDDQSSVDLVKKVKEETRASILFCDAKHKGKIKIKTVCFDEIYAFTKEVKDKKVGKDAIAQIVYTSGTTGEPKGVVLTYRNLESNVESVTSVFSFPKRSSILSCLPLSHLLGQSALLLSCRQNLDILIPASISARHLLNLLERHRCLALVGVPRILESLRVSIRQSTVRGYAARLLPYPLKAIPLLKEHKRLGFLKVFICGAAPLDPELERFWDRFGVRVIQGYGLTETSPVVSFNRLFNKRVGSVGEPIPGVEVKIALDGEVCVKGDNVFKGYFKKPQVTRDVFAGGFFKTGDLGYCKDKFLYLKGRKKDMIVTQAGLNVYPEDIERVLLKMKGVRDASIVGFPKDIERVHAVLILDAGVSPRKIVEQANAKLPDHEQIQAYTLWKEAVFPKTSTQKVQKFKLLEYLEREHEDVQLGKTRDPLISLLSEVTRVPVKKISPGSKLSLDLKLASLDRLELVARIEDEFQVDIEETAIGSDTTVADLKSMVEGMRLKKRRSVRRWVNSGIACAIRSITQPIAKVYVNRICDVSFKGVGNLSKLKRPALIVANHASNLDTAMIMLAMKDKRSTVAVWAEYFEQIPKGQFMLRTLHYYLGPLVMNGFLFPQNTGFRQAFENAGELVDNGWNIILFPEGERTKDGRMHHFKPGVGLLWQGLQIPILPIKIEGLFKIWPRTGFKKKGKVQVTIGKPFIPKAKETLMITKEIEEKVRKL